MRARTRLTALLVGLLVVTTGCTSISATGPIEQVPMSAQPPGIDVAPKPPQEGATPTRLVEGFLQAMADPKGDYQVARQYLTSEASDAWEPTSAVVFDGAVTGDAESAGISGTQVGSLDGSGHYTARLQSFHHDFALVDEGGQWRIGAAPDGLLLSRYIFERYYREVSIYFVSTAGSHVVPDPVHLPEAQVTPTSIVEALLDGPSDGLSRAVTNALPAAVKLGSEAASIDSQGIVTVDLTGISENLGDDARRRLGAQLLWSLTAIPRVTGLVVTRDGLVFTLPDSNAQGVFELNTQQGWQVLSRGVNHDLFAVRDGVPGRIANPFDSFSTGETRYSEISASLDGATLALVDEGRTQLWMGARSAEMTLVETGLTNLRDPQFVLGTLWVLGEGPEGGSVLTTVQRSGKVERVVFDAPPDARIVSFAVSPTRARVGLVLDISGQRKLGLATVVDSKPVNVVAWEQLHLIADNDEALTDPQSMRWSDETKLAVIASNAGQRSVYTAHVDGSEIEDLSPVAGEAVEVAALPRMGGGPVAIRIANGAVWRFDARTRWNRLADQITSIAYGG